jgi:hypothetical protein
LNEESRIGFAFLKVVLEKKILKAFIPCSRSLLEPIEHLMGLVHMVGEVWIFEARWLINIYFFFERSIQKCTLDVHSKCTLDVHSKCTLDVHLMKLEVMMSSIGQKDTN